MDFTDNPLLFFDRAFSGHNNIQPLQEWQISSNIIKFLVKANALNLQKLTQVRQPLHKSLSTVGMSTRISSVSISLGLKKTSGH